MTSGSRFAGLFVLAVALGVFAAGAGGGYYTYTELSDGETVNVTFAADSPPQPQGFTAAGNETGRPATTTTATTTTPDTTSTATPNTTTTTTSPGTTTSTTTTSTSPPSTTITTSTTTTTTSTTTTTTGNSTGNASVSGPTGLFPAVEPGWADGP